MAGSTAPQEQPFDHVLDRIQSPSDLRELSDTECEQLAGEIRQFLVESVARTGGHLGSNLGAVELTIALHRVFDSPSDLLVFDTGHQAYVHKLVTGRKDGFARLRQAGGLSGYPNRTESAHDLVENSHASTSLSYAYGLAQALRAKGQDDPAKGGRHVVAVIGDGALTGGMAYEALNNLGHSSSRVLIVLNDNGRSYAPTVSRLSGSLTQLRLDPRYVEIRQRLQAALSEVPVMGAAAGLSFRGLTSALREVVEPHVFFEALGVRYTGPIDGHDVAALEQALRRASSWNGPIVLHVLTRKGKGYGPAEDDEVACLHDLKVAPSPGTSPERVSSSGAIAPPDPGPLRPLALGESYTEAFSKALIEAAEVDRRVVAITAAMPGPTGLLSFKDHFEGRFIDVGIAEQHAMTAAAGMALGGLKPVVCIYSTFLARCVDQWNLDVGLHQAGVVVVADRAGVTGDDGPSHHGLYDMVQALQVPGCAVYAPSEPAEIAPALAEALRSPGPALVRYPKTPSPGPLAARGEPGRSRLLYEGSGGIVLVGIGKLARACLEAARLLEESEADLAAALTVVDALVVRPADPALVALMASAEVVVTAEDGLAHGGAGAHLSAEASAAAAADHRAGPRVVNLGVPATYLPQAKPDDILASLGLDAAGIAGSLAEAARRFGLEVGVGGPSGLHLRNGEVNHDALRLGRRSPSTELEGGAVVAGRAAR